MGAVERWRPDGLSESHNEIRRTRLDGEGGDRCASWVVRTGEPWQIGWADALDLEAEIMEEVTPQHADGILHLSLIAQCIIYAPYPAAQLGAVMHISAETMEAVSAVAIEQWRGHLSPVNAAGLPDTRPLRLGTTHVLTVDPSPPCNLNTSYSCTFITRRAPLSSTRNTQQLAP